MKITKKSLLALLLAFGLLFSLAACGLFDPDTVDPVDDPLDPLPEPGAATLAYFNEKVLPLLPQSTKYTVEVSYSIGDTQVENEAFKAALPEIKKLLTKGLAKKDEGLRFGEGAYPLLRNPLRTEDVTGARADSVLELEIAKAIGKVRSDYESKNLETQTLKQTLEEYGELYEKLKGDALNTWVETVMAEKAYGENGEVIGFTDDKGNFQFLPMEALRLYTIQAKVGDVSGGKTHYQLEFLLGQDMDLEAAARYIEPEDKAWILAELAKADAYLRVSDYEKAAWVDAYTAEELEKEERRLAGKTEEDRKLANIRDLTPTYRVVCVVNNTTNRLESVELVARYSVSAELRGAGGLEKEGAFPVGAQFAKTVKIAFEWPEIKKEG